MYEVVPISLTSWRDNDSEGVLSKCMFYYNIVKGVFYIILYYIILYYIII